LAPIGERRHLTVLFCDIVGSTALAKSLDPEELNDVTRGYYESCTSAIAQFDGLVANYIGDGIMALFGYPRAHEDDAERATHAALGILRAVRSANSTGRYACTSVSASRQDWSSLARTAPNL
jgi:class 3 adenylate cyclase